jgi:hypothetical protein
MRTLDEHFAGPVHDYLGQSFIREVGPERVEVSFQHPPLRRWWLCVWLQTAGICR